MTRTHRTSRSTLARGGFTLVELLAVIAIIAVLVGILLVSFSGVLGTARRSVAERLLRSVAQGVDSFKNDLGYLPPLLSVEGTGLGQTPPNRSLATLPEYRTGSSEGPVPTPSAVVENLRETRYGSEYTIGVYLLGTGDIDGRKPPNGEDSVNATDPNPGANSSEDDGEAGPGIRDPGPDRSWGGAAWREDQWDEDFSPPKPRAIRTGKVYGPYLDVAQLGESVFIEPQTGLAKLVDVWDQPVRYYTRWPVTDRATTGTPEPSVEYTPVEIRGRSSVEAQMDTTISDAERDLLLERDRDVLNAPYALLSAGKPTLFKTESAATPAFYKAKGQEPLALFGDRREGTGAEYQDMEQPFDPSALTPADQMTLIEELADNVRYLP
jgi:prepilin-type N-terminal cleavage/methylation domain-containing protein